MKRTKRRLLIAMAMAFALLGVAINEVIETRNNNRNKQDQIACSPGDELSDWPIPL